MQTQRTSFIKNKNRKEGFSLPEVALSMGIAATALLTLVSLLPMGLDTLRTSNQKQAEARILQAVMDRYQTSAWLDQSSGQASGQPLDRTLFFAQTGTEVDSVTSNLCNYAVQVTVGRAPTLNGDSRGNEYLRELRVRITDRTQDYKSALANESGKYRERSVWIALMEQTGPMNTSGQTSYSSL